MTTYPTTRLVIVMDGGIIQAVVSDNPPEDIDIVVLDYDVEGVDEADIHLISQPADPDGRPYPDAEAYIYDVPITHAAIDIDQVFDLCDKPSA